VTSAATLIMGLSQSGVIFSRCGDQLVLDGPETIITDPLVDRVRSLKAEIMQALGYWGPEDWQALFDERADIAQHDGGASMMEAGNDFTKQKHFHTVPLERGSRTEGGFSPPFRRSVPALSLGLERGTNCSLGYGGAA